MPKAQAVAQETLAVWCSLASRLGVWALKTELEDLCFAVLKVCLNIACNYLFQYVRITVNFLG
jgi:(p)ppGpp synthase/HD superfamily hydrolase